MSQRLITESNLLWSFSKFVFILITRPNAVYIVSIKAHKFFRDYHLCTVQIKDTPKETVIILNLATCIFCHINSVHDMDTYTMYMYNAVYAIQFTIFLRSTAIFTPDLAFTATVRGIIARFKEPLQECVDDVVEVLSDTITECANQVQLGSAAILHLQRDFLADDGTL